MSRGRQPDSVPATRAPAAEWVHLSTLRPWRENPRRFDDHQVNGRAAQIERFGIGDSLTARHPPSVVGIVSGHLRHAAMVRLLERRPDFVLDGAPGPGFVPVRWRDDLTDDEAVRLAIASNADEFNGAWEDDALQRHLSAMSEDDRELLGFGADEPDGEALKVTEVDVSDASDARFWLSVEGPLPAQPDVLDRLREALAAMPGVTVQFV